MIEDGMLVVVCVAFVVVSILGIRGKRDNALCPWNCGFKLPDPKLMTFEKAGSMCYREGATCPGCLRKLSVVYAGSDRYDWGMGEAITDKTGYGPNR